MFQCPTKGMFQLLVVSFRRLLTWYENRRLSDVFRRYRRRPWHEMGYCVIAETLTVLSVVLLLLLGQLFLRCFTVLSTVSHKFRCI